MTVYATTNCSAQILDIQPRCNMPTALHNGEVRITIAYTVPELHASRYMYKCPRMFSWVKGKFCNVLHMFTF